MTEEDGPPPFKEFDARLKRLRQTDQRRPPEADEQPQRLRWGSGLQVGVELVAGTAGGSLLGWGLDRWLGTAPFGFIVLFFLGAAAGMLNAWRHLRRMQDENPR